METNYFFGNPVIAFLVTVQNIRQPVKLKNLETNELVKKLIKIYTKSLLRILI